MMENAPAILLIEDDEKIQSLLVRALEENGFAVLAAGTAAEAIEKAEVSKPDAVLADVYLPDLNGIKLIEHIRKQKWGAAIPIFLLTNASEIETIAEAMSQEISGYFIKADWEIEKMVAQMRKYLW